MYEKKLLKSKRPVNLLVDEKLLKQAKNSDLNISAVLDKALREELGKRWQLENADAIDAYNARVENLGLWCDEYRKW
jgi:antitoxin CcdA